MATTDYTRQLQEIKDEIIEARAQTKQARYSNDLKKRVAALLLSGVPRKELMDVLNLSSSQIYTWRKCYHPEPPVVFDVVQPPAAPAHTLHISNSHIQMVLGSWTIAIDSNGI